MINDKNFSAPEFSVSEISNAIKQQIEELFGYVRIKGEILQPKIAASGHCYMRLKDENATIDAIIWRGNMKKLKHPPQEGMEIIASGRVTTYPLRSSYQIIIDNFELAGEGALLKLLEDRKKTLTSEGLFDDSRKKELPLIPETIGVVTSETGAVIRDILHRIRERYPSRVILWPVSVQGEMASSEISAAILGFNQFSLNKIIPRPDIIIVARGGGSLEDLWAFNEEEVVRAVASSEIPVISAIGHETDTTLIDYVSDKRAPTPTAAAEIAVPVRTELLDQVRQKGLILTRIVNQRLLSEENHLKGLARGIPKLSYLVEQKQQELDSFFERIVLGPKRLIDVKEKEFEILKSNLKTRDLYLLIKNHNVSLSDWFDRLNISYRQNIKLIERSLNNLSGILKSVSPQRVLERGYAIVKDYKGEVVTESVLAEKNKNLRIQFKDSEILVSLSKKKNKKEDKRQESFL